MWINAKREEIVAEITETRAMMYFLLDAYVFVDEQAHQELALVLKGEVAACDKAIEALVHQLLGL